MKPKKTRPSGVASPLNGKDLADHDADDDLDAWAAQELHGWTKLKKKPDGSYEGKHAGTTKPVPQISTNWHDFVATHDAVLPAGRRLKLKALEMAVAVEHAQVPVKHRNEVQLLGVRALILFSLHQKGLA